MADLSQTAADVALVSGNAALVVGAESITAGMQVYLDRTVNQYRLGKANATGKKKPTALALTSCDTGGFLVIAGAGCQVTIGATVTKGEIVVQSGATAGNLAPTADLSTGWDVNIIGIAPNTTDLLLTFNNSGITL